MSRSIPLYMNKKFVNHVPEVETDWQSMNLVQEAIEAHRDGFDDDTPELIIFTHLAHRFVMEKGWEVSTFLKYLSFSDKQLRKEAKQELGGTPFKDTVSAIIGFGKQL
jgi:hypothetical protein